MFLEGLGNVRKDLECTYSVSRGTLNGTGRIFNAIREGHVMQLEGFRILVEAT